MHDALFVAKPKMSNDLGKETFDNHVDAVKYLNEFNQLEEQGLAELTAEDWVMIGKLEVPAGIYFKNNKIMGEVK